MVELLHMAKRAESQIEVTIETIIDVGLRWEVNDGWTLSGGVGGSKVSNPRRPD